MVDWVSHNNHAENRDQEITGIYINIHIISMTVDVLVSTSIKDIRVAMNIDLKMLKTYIVTGWLHNNGEVEHGIDRYWPIRHKQVMVDDIAMKHKQIIILYILQKQILQ